MVAQTARNVRSTHLGRADFAFFVYKSERVRVPMPFDHLAENAFRLPTDTIPSAKFNRLEHLPFLIPRMVRVCLLANLGLPYEVPALEAAVELEAAAALAASAAAACTIIWSEEPRTEASEATPYP